MLMSTIWSDPPPFLLSQLDSRWNLFLVKYPAQYFLAWFQCLHHPFLSMLHGWRSENKPCDALNF